MAKTKLHSVEIKYNLDIGGVITGAEINHSIVKGIIFSSLNDRVNSIEVDAQNFNDIAIEIIETSEAMKKEFDTIKKDVETSKSDITNVEGEIAIVDEKVTSLGVDFNAHNHNGFYAEKLHKHKMIDIEDLEFSHNHDDTYAKKIHTHTLKEVPHNHDENYAQKSHVHLDYAKITHKHKVADLEDLNLSHNHDERYEKLNHNHDADYSRITHSHSDYAINTHNHNGSYAPLVGGKVPTENLPDLPTADHNHDSLYAKKTDKASSVNLGLVKVGDGLEIEEDGTLNCTVKPSGGGEGVVGYKYTVTATDWVAESDKFTYILNHQKDIAVEKLGVEFYNSLNEAVLVDYKFENNNTIKIVSYSNVELIVIIKKSGGVEEVIPAGEYRSIESDVYKVEHSPMMVVRYIRSSIEGGAHSGSKPEYNNFTLWTEVQALDVNGFNVAIGKTVTADSTPTIGTLPMVVDGITTNNNDTKVVGWNDKNKHWIKIDLGEEFKLTTLKWWHYYNLPDSTRGFNNLIYEVSSDGVSWIEVFNTNKDGDYVDSPSGKSVKLESSYIEIPSTVIPMSDTIDVELDGRDTVVLDSYIRPRCTDKANSLDKNGLGNVYSIRNNLEVEEIEIFISELATNVPLELRVHLVDINGYLSNTTLHDYTKLETLYVYPINSAEGQQIIKTPGCKLIKDNDYIFEIRKLVNDNSKLSLCYGYSPIPVNNFSSAQNAIVSIIPGNTIRGDAKIAENCYYEMNFTFKYESQIPVAKLPNWIPSYDKIEKRVSVLEEEGGGTPPVTREYLSIKPDVYVAKNNYRDGMHDLTLDGCTASIITDAVRTSQPLLTGNYVSERGVLKQLNNTTGNYIVGYFKDRKFDMNIVDEVVIEMRKKITNISDASNRIVNTFFLQKVDENLPEDRTNGLIFQYLNNEFVIAGIWNGGAMSNYPAVQVGNVEIKPDVFYDYKIVIKKDVGFEFYINDTLIGSLADSTNRQYYLSLCGFNSRQEYSRIAYSNGGFVSEIEIPAEVIPMSDTIPIQLEPAEAFDYSRTYTRATDPVNWVVAWYDGSKLIAGDGAVSRSWIIPILVESSTTMTVTVTNDATRFRLGYTTTDSIPQGGSAVTRIVYDDAIKTHTFNVAPTWRWLVVYCSQVPDNTGHPNLTIEYKKSKMGIQMPNWVPSFDKLRSEVLGETGNSNIPIVESITGDEPENFTAIVKGVTPYIVANLGDTGWFRTSMIEFNPKLEYKILTIPVNSATSSTYNYIESTYQFKINVAIDYIELPWLQIEKVVVNGKELVGSYDRLGYYRVYINKEFVAGEAINVEVTNSSFVKASYWNPRYEDSVLKSMLCYFGSTDYTTTFTVPIVINYAVL